MSGTAPDDNGIPPADEAEWTARVPSQVGNLRTVTTAWEIADSYNLSNQNPDAPFQYANLLSASRKIIHAADPEALIGFSLANFDLKFLDEAMRAGAVGNFDFISLSPYPCSPGSSPQFATVLTTLRALLESRRAPPGLPILITLTGTPEALAECAPLALSLGFSGVFIRASPELITALPVKPASLPVRKIPADRQSVSFTFGNPNQPDGLYQINPTTTPWDPTLKANRLRLNAIPPATSTSFLAAPGFLAPDDSKLSISVTARRLPSPGGMENPTGLGLSYEGKHGYRLDPSWWVIPGGNEWQTQVWTIDDASFDGRLGYHFRLDASGAGNDLLIKEISLSR